jgi:hypothetical protein
MGQIFQTGNFDKRFIALGNREMLIRPIYWPMEEFLKGERELTVAMICNAVNNVTTASQWPAQTLDFNDSNSFYFGLRSVRNTSSLDYEFLPYTSGSAFIGLKSSGSVTLHAGEIFGWYDQAVPLTGPLSFNSKKSEDINFSLLTPGHVSEFSSVRRYSYENGCPTHCTQIVITFKYDKLTNSVYSRWKYVGNQIDTDGPESVIISEETARTELLSVLNYSTAHFNISGSITSSVDLTNDNIMNFFVFWPFTNARLAIQAYGWQLT